VVDREAHVGKGDQFSELDAYLEDQQRGKKRSLSEIEKVGTIAALNRCRDLLRQIQSGLANKSSEEMTSLQSLADFQVSLERAAFVLEYKAGEASKSPGGDC
jgi:hypothetical protein